MIRLSIPWLFIAAIGLAGCAGGGTTTPSSSSGSASLGSASDSPAGRCVADKVQNVIGEAYSERLAESARNRSGAATVRTLMPGQVMTMEYRPTRLTIVVGDDQRIASVRCG